MKHICFILMMLIALTASAAGLQELVNSLKKPPVTAPPAPQAPHPPKLPAPQQPVKK